MHDGNNADIIRRLADRQLKASRILNNPYFTRLKSGEMTLPVFRRTQEQFYFAVEYFSRPMAALLMRLPRPEQRLSILSNVVEEHGGFHTSAFHEATFREFLASIGGQSERPRPCSRGPEVHAFNASIMAACCSDDVYTGIACLGIVEYAFADISAVIGRAIVARQWVARGELKHYALHAEIDKQHAAEFFALLESVWNDEATHMHIEQGFRLGTYVFDRLYRDLLAMAESQVPDAPE